MIRHDISLKPYNTFGIDVLARQFAAFRSVEQLDALIRRDRQQPLLLLGGGSNVLLTKQIDYLVLKNELKGIQLKQETERDVTVEVMAGEVWHDFVAYAVEHRWGGIENLALIPGSVGAAPMQNIGAYGVEMKDTFVELEAYEIATGAVHTFSKEACQLGYRESIFKRSLKGQFVILSATFKLSKNPVLKTSYGALSQFFLERNMRTPTLRAVFEAVSAIRTAKLPDPRKWGNAGSFFKNPIVDRAQLSALKRRFPQLVSYPLSGGREKLAAAWLIDQAGWKGKRQGNCGVHDRQALVLVNYGGAGGAEIYRLSEAILQEVNRLYGITLEREVNVIQ